LTFYNASLLKILLVNEAIGQASLVVALPQSGFGVDGVDGDLGRGGHVAVQERPEVRRRLVARAPRHAGNVGYSGLESISQNRFGRNFRKAKCCNGLWLVYKLRKKCNVVTYKNNVIILII
jgi:hypothetical protein